MPERAQVMALCSVFSALMLSACAGPSTPPLAPDQLWNPDSSAVLFRADLTGGTLPELARISETPLCTVYGDGRVVWVNELDAFNTEILFDFVQPEAIEQFINTMVLTEQFYDLDARATEPPTGESAPVVQAISMDVAGIAHRADSLGSWEQGYFDSAVTLCRTISQTPIRFEPTEGWVTVREVDAMPDAPTILWNAEDHGGIALADLASGEQPRWVSGTAVSDLWRILHTLPYTVVLSDGERRFQAGLQAPGITRDAPPRPEAAN